MTKLKKNRNTKTYKMIKIQAVTEQSRKNIQDSKFNIENYQSRYSCKRRMFYGQ